MTKEELEKEAEEKYSEVDREFIVCQDEGEVFNIGYILGAEPREKRIAELIALINAERERQKKCDDVHLRTVAELEKENAELKKQLEMSNKVYNDNLDYSHHIEEQLTKAKAIIKTFLGFAEAFGYSPSMDKFIAEAEQFLKDSEVK